MTHRLTLEFSVMTVNAQGQIERQEQRQNQADSLSLPEDIGLTLVMIPAGTLMMGAPVTEEGFKRSQGPQHRVDLPTFWMSQTAITQAQWEVVTLLPKVNLSL
ncbi:MAG: formylglycine-generating enzyme family protein, partial [Microcystaceae cyanobacterium]